MSCFKNSFLIKVLKRVIMTVYTTFAKAFERYSYASFFSCVVTDFVWSFQNRTLYANPTSRELKRKNLERKRNQAHERNMDECELLHLEVQIYIYMSRISYYFHCFYKTFCFIQLFANVAPINNIIPTSYSHIIVVTLAILYIRSYSIVKILI